MEAKDAKLLNGLALAYMGDAIYELHIRKHLLTTGQTKPNQLHRLATNYVSAKAQAYLLEEMMTQELLTKEEQDYFRRGRNAKSYTKAKNTNVATYKTSSGFEAIFGYLHLTGQNERVETLVHWCIEQIEKEN